MSRYMMSCGCILFGGGQKSLGARTSWSSNWFGLERFRVRTVALAPHTVPFISWSVVSVSRSFDGGWGWVVVGWWWGAGIVERNTHAHRFSTLPIAGHRRAGRRPERAIEAEAGDQRLEERGLAAEKGAEAYNAQDSPGDQANAEQGPASGAPVQAPQPRAPQPRAHAAEDRRKADEGPGRHVEEGSAAQAANAWGCRGALQPEEVESHLPIKQLIKKLRILILLCTAPNAVFTFQLALRLLVLFCG